MKEYICREDLLAKFEEEEHKPQYCNDDNEYELGQVNQYDYDTQLIKTAPTVTKADICREFADELKESFNNEFPANYPSTKPYFTLEGARILVDLVLKEVENG